MKNATTGGQSRLSGPSNLLRPKLLTVLLILCCCFQLSADTGALKSDIEKELLGREFVSKIVFGDKGSPPGYSAAYPVNTLFYPDSGRVVYRVEWGLIRGEVGSMGRFNQDASFRVTAVDLKEDRLPTRA